MYLQSGWIELFIILQRLYIPTSLPLSWSLFCKLIFQALAPGGQPFVKVSWQLASLSSPSPELCLIIINAIIRTHTIYYRPSLSPVRCVRALSPQNRAWRESHSRLLLLSGCDISVPHTFSIIFCHSAPNLINFWYCAARRGFSHYPIMRY